MIATLLLVACLGQSADSCVHVEVPPSVEVAGAAGNPINIPLTFGACMGAVGQNAAKEFWQQHPVYSKHRFGGWRCRLGDRAGPKEVSA
jgi:hypothetical protein